MHKDNQICYSVNNELIVFNKEEIELISVCVHNQKMNYTCCSTREQEIELEKIQHKLWKVLQQGEKDEET